MAWTNKRKYMVGKAYRIPLDQYPSLKGGTRIRIPQPTYRPYLRPVSAVKRELLKESVWWISARRRRRLTEIGVDQLEARAVPRDVVRGTLPERIIYKYLADVLRISFDFQSSLQGGRMEAGGAVADFIIFPYEKDKQFVLNVQGPTHGGFLRSAKDEEQAMTLESMGFKVYEIDMDVIYDVYRFEEYMRRLFGLAQGFGGGGGSFSEEDWIRLAPAISDWQLDYVINALHDLNGRLDIAKGRLFWLQ